ncbi:hypothetical protein MHI24_22255 [Paenibacillus sp. FSL K6-1096]|uniref:hypothetical protein n=1 Tax=Paenibacillus sp. FSL K6-1096 TaxID=2921460 RepID=UPI0030ED5F0F
MEENKKKEPCNCGQHIESSPITVPAGGKFKDISLRANACLSNQSDFINGAVISQGTSYNIIDLAKWVSWQSFQSPYFGVLPISLVLAHWAFEHGWSRSSFQSAWNPGFQTGTCGYSGTTDNTPHGTFFNNVIQGVSAYAHLLISGYRHVQFAYSHAGFGNTGLNAACTALRYGFYANYTGSSTSYCSSQSYALNSTSTRRLWTASGGYQNMYETITGRDCLNNYTYQQSSDPNVYGFNNISW